MIKRTDLTSSFVRRKTIELSFKTGAGHLASSLSCVEILTVLFRDFLVYDVNDSLFNGRDRLIFSKGHGAYAYYVILNAIGFLPDFELENFYTERSSIKGCLTLNKNYMIEASTGSLGHGLPIAVGMAKALKMRSIESKVICIVGDGEMQEGSNFEALIYANRFKLDNLAVIVDANGLQAMDYVENIGIDNTTLFHAMSAFTDSSYSFRLNGHDEYEISKAFEFFFHSKGEKNGFSIFFCDTIKGKGIPLIENNPKYHFRCLTEDGYKLQDICP